jgi:hypothetical protein
VDNFATDQHTSTGQSVVGVTHPWIALDGWHGWLFGCVPVASRDTVQCPTDPAIRKLHSRMPPAPSACPVCITRESKILLVGISRTVRVPKAHDLGYTRVFHLVPCRYWSRPSSPFPHTRTVSLSTATPSILAWPYLLLALPSFSFLSLVQPTTICFSPFHETAFLSSWLSLHRHSFQSVLSLAGNQIISKKSFVGNH